MLLACLDIGSKGTGYIGAMHALCVQPEVWMTMNSHASVASMSLPYCAKRVFWNCSRVDTQSARPTHRQAETDRLIHRQTD